MKQILVLFLICTEMILLGTDIILDNGSIQAHIIHPASGYYSGARFETGGFVRKLIFQNINFFGCNYKKNRSPENPDQVCGNAEDFKTFSGMTENGVFMKIGNGVFRQKKGETWQTNGNYICLKRFPWKIWIKKNQVRLEQSGDWNGYSYQYEKIIRLPEGEAAMEISYTIRNTGTREIRNSQYAHNFIAYNESIPPGTKVTWDGTSFRATPKRANPPWIQKGNTLVVENKLRPSFTFISAICKEKNRVRICFPNGFLIEITEMYEPEEIGFYIGTNHLCPESFVPVRIKPGEISHWKRMYRLTRFLE